MSARSVLPDLLDPATFDEGPPREPLSALAERRYVRAWSEREQLHYWAIGGHRHVSEFVRDWRRLSSHANGTILLADRPGLRGALTDMDPPRHTLLRRAVTGRFKPIDMDRIEHTVRTAAAQALTVLTGAGGGDLVTAIRSIPATVTGELFGIPLPDRDRVSHLGHLINFAEDPSYRTVVEQACPHQELAAYAHELAARQRRQPSPGLIADLLATGPDEAPITVDEFEAMFVLLVAAGTGTTIDALVSAVRLLHEHPGAMDQLRSGDPRAYRTAVEEVLRWATPVNYFARTATAPIDLNGSVIQTGDRVALYFAAANFDERVFRRAGEFDPQRVPNPHLTFGGGIHSCVGPPLARLELRVVLEELCRNYEIDNVDTHPRRIVSHINNGFAEVGCRLRRVAGR